MRPMVMEFTEDPACDYLDRQYMLGDSLLVAPIMRPDGMVTYYLPAGTWTHFVTGEKVEGGRWVTEQHGYMSLPLMARPGSIVAVGNVDTRPDYDYDDGVTLHLFELGDGESTSTTVYAMDGEPKLRVIAKRQDAKLNIQATGTGKPWSVLLRGVDRVQAAAGANTEITEDGIKITPYRFADSEISVQL